MAQWWLSGGGIDGRVCVLYGLPKHANFFLQQSEKTDFQRTDFQRTTNPAHLILIDFAIRRELTCYIKHYPLVAEFEWNRQGTEKEIILYGPKFGTFDERKKIINVCDKYVRSYPDSGEFPDLNMF